MASRAEFHHASAVVTGRRTSQRARLHLAAMLECTTRVCRVLIRNLSSTGAMIQGTGLPESGRLVTLKRPGLDLIGIIVWKDDDLCGIEFDEPLDRDEVIKLARSAPEPLQAPPAAHYQRPGVEEERLSPEDWARSRDYAARKLRSYS